MKQRITKILAVALAVLAALWAVDKLPFAQTIDRQVEAAVYRDGEVVETTTVTIRGTKSRYLFRADSFVGELRVPYLERTDVDGLQTQIRWSSDGTQTIRHFYMGNFFTAEKRGLRTTLLMEEDMEHFALMTTGQEVIATSRALYDRCMEQLAPSN